MKAGLALVSVLLMSIGGWCQTEQVSTVTESGDIRDVIAFSGTVSSSERFVANERESSYKKSLKGKNVSGKAILLLIVALDCCATHQVYRWDNFLGGPIKQEEDILFADSEESRVSRLGNPLLRSSPPAATASVLYVQFADGTTLGDESDAEEALAERTATLKALRELAAVYASSGDEAFKEALGGTFSGEAAAYIGTYRKAADTKGAAAAIAMITNRLHFADVNASRLATAK